MKCYFHISLDMDTNESKSIFILSASNFYFCEQMCALCQAELVNAQHLAISYILFQKWKHICFSLEISRELRELERFSFGATKRACVGREGFSPVPFLSFFQSTYFSLAKISLLFTAGIRSRTSSPLFWKHLLLMMQLLLQ